MRETNLEQIRRCQQICREHGMALTVQRRVILEAMLDRSDHPSAERVYEEVKDRVPGMSRMTVYRNLRALTKLGIIAELHHLSAARFDPKSYPHWHLVCVRCGKVADCPADAGPRIEPPRALVHGFRISDYQLYFRGTCAECRRKVRGSGVRPRARGRPPRSRRVSKARRPQGRQ